MERDIKAADERLSETSAVCEDISVAYRQHFHDPWGAMPTPTVRRTTPCIGDSSETHVGPVRRISFWWNGKQREVLSPAFIRV